MWLAMAHTLERLLVRMTGLGRLRTSALVALGSLSLAATARTSQTGAELVSWLLSWLLVAFFGAYLVLLLCALLVPPETAGARPARRGRGRAAERPGSERQRPAGARRAPNYAGST